MWSIAALDRQRKKEGTKKKTLQIWIIDYWNAINNFPTEKKKKKKQTLEKPTISKSSLTDFCNVDENVIIDSWNIHSICTSWPQKNSLIFIYSFIYLKKKIPMKKII